METEIWKDMPDYEGLYKVSNLGRIKSIRTQRKQYKQYKTIGYVPKESKNKYVGSINKKTGYVRCSLCKNGVQNRLYVHEIVAITFLGYKKTNRKICINHIDGIKNNNKLKNLEIVTQSYNVKDSFLKGRVIHNKGIFGVNKKILNSGFKIFMYDLNNNQISAFDSYYDAEVATGIKSATIRKNVSVGSINNAGYIFKKQLY